VTPRVSTNAVGADTEKNRQQAHEAATAEIRRQVAELERLRRSQRLTRDERERRLELKRILGE